MARSTRTRRQPFDWMLGCGTFGYLHHADGRDLLVETIRFTENEAVAVNLTDGGTRLILPDWAGAHQFTRLTPAAACGVAAIPAPVTRKVGDMHRRVDPFHTERYLNAQFRALVALIFDKRLPCGHGLLLHAHADGWSERWEGPHIEDPEQTAGNVAERQARNADWTLARAVRDQLQHDARTTPEELDELLERSTWASVLTDIDALVAERHDAAPYPLYTDHAAPTTSAATGDADTPQLTLL